MATARRKAPQRRGPAWFRWSPEAKLILATACVQAIFYYATRNAELDEVKRSVDRVERNVTSLKESFDKGLPAAKDELKQYVKERDDFRQKQIDRLDEEGRRRADETAKTLKEQADILLKLERYTPQALPQDRRNK